MAAKTFNVASGGGGGEEPVINLGEKEGEKVKKLLDGREYAPNHE